ncbi:MAG: hypothetical protein WAO91_06945 [Candidatus Nitrosotenuis sp.]
MTRHRYWKITADEIIKSDYDPSKVLNWEIKGIRAPEDQAVFIGVFLYKNGTPYDYESIKGISFYYNNVKRSEVGEVTKFLKDKFGGVEKEKGERIILQGSREIYAGKDVGQLAKELEARFSLKSVISIEFKDISEGERKKLGLADAKLLPIPGNK